MRSGYKWFFYFLITGGRRNFSIVVFYRSSILRIYGNFKIKIIPGFLENSRTVCQKDGLHQKEHLSQALDVAVGLGQIVGDVLDHRLGL